MSDACAPFSRLRERRERKKCPNKQITAQNLWPSIRLHGIKLQVIKLPIKHHGIKLQDIMLLNIKPYGIKSQGIMPYGARLFSISGLSRNLFLPSKMVNQRLTNPSTSKSHRRWRMIKTSRSYLFGCRAWYSGWIKKEGWHGSRRRKTFTPWGGMDSPSWWEFSCLEFGS